MKKKKLLVAALLIALLLVLAIPSAFASSEENPEIVEIISTVVEEESKEEIAEEPKEEPAEEPEEKAAEEPEEEPAEESVEEAAEENEEEPAEESKKMEIEVSTASNEIVLIDKSTGTAPFTIEATFNGKQVKFDGKTSYSLADLAADLGIEGTIVGAKSSEESLFNVVDDKFESYTTFVNEYDLTFIMDDGSTFVVTVSDDTNVAKVNGTEYADINAAIAAANAGDTVYIIVPTFDSDINLTKALTLVGKSDDNGTKTTLKGTISGVTNCTIDNFIFSSTFSNTLTNCTIKNCTFIGTEAGGGATRWLYTNGNTVFDNCTFDPKGQYGIHFDGNSGGNVLVKNCSIKGTVALSGPNISFLGCKFEGRSTSGHCNINIYGKALFNNCTFDEAYTNGSSRGILMLGDNDSASVTMNNCSVNSETYSIEDVFRFDWRQGTGLIDAKLYLGKNVVSGIVAVSKNADIASIVAAGSTYSLLKADQNGNTWEVTAPESSPVSDQKEDNRIVVTVEGDSNVRVEAEISEKKAVISDITAEAIKEAINVNNSNGSVKIDCSNTGSAVSQVEIKADSIKTIASSDVKELKVSMDSGSIALDKAALSSVVENLDGKTVTLVVENIKENVLNNTQQKAVETALASKQNAKVVAVIDSYILTDTSKIKDLGSGTAKLEISADNLASDNGNLDNLVIYEISEDGTMKKVEFKIVDGKIVINANKLAQYVITVE